MKENGDGKFDDAGFWIFLIIVVICVTVMTLYSKQFEHDFWGS